MMRRLRGVLAITLLMLGSGCGITIKQSSRGLLPVIPAQPRPTLVGLTAEEQLKVKQVDQKVLDTINENFKQVHMYAVQLETGIKQYNEYAEKNNELVRKENGLPDVVTGALPQAEKKE